ncbi:MAG: hypothetical protein KIS96_07690 [Bauldia sp.]|nr:hypothetical protein [Bauldia sp.]
MTRARQTTYRVLGAAIVTAALAGSALAEGSWVRGGSFENNEPVAFGRYLAEATDAQMTVRCADSELSIDAGVAGAGALPEGLAEGDTTSVGFVLIGTDGAELGSTDAEGPLRIRPDGAVVVTLAGEAAAPLAALLLEPAESLAVTIGAETRPVVMTGAAAIFAGIAASCDAWPK